MNKNVAKTAILKPSIYPILLKSQLTLLTISLITLTTLTPQALCGTPLSGSHEPQRVKSNNYRQNTVKFKFFPKLVQNQPITVIQNLFKEKLQICGTNPTTGYYKNGKCTTGLADKGSHTVCGIMTQDFLQFTKSRGNDLITPNEYFPGLKPGDRWCLCAKRWQEAFQQGKAPDVILEATEISTLKFNSLEELKSREFNEGSDEL